MPKPSCPVCIAGGIAECRTHQCEACLGLGFHMDGLGDGGTGICRRCYGVQREPYYAEDGITIFHGDVLELLAKGAAASVDAIITDPPYNVGKDFGNGAAADRRQDYDAWLNTVWAECGRVAKDGAILAYTNRIAHLPAGMAPPTPWRLLHVGVWRKPLSLAGTFYGIAPHWEPIFFLVKGKPWRSFRGPDVLGDVLSHNVQRNRRGHPTEKPLDLMRDIVAFASPLRGLVLDPFCGSGTTGVAAKELGRSFMGYDDQLAWAHMATKRLAATERREQPCLLAPPQPAAQAAFEEMP